MSKVKSIRLNMAMRIDIANNVRAAYIEENSAPAVEDNRALRLHTAIMSIYRKDIAATEKQFETAGHLVQKHRKTTQYFNVYLPKEPEDSAYYSYKSVSSISMDGETVYEEAAERLTVLNLQSNCWYDWREGKVPAIITKAMKDNKTEAKAIRKQKAALSEWETKLNNYMVKVNQVLNGVNTTAQLLEAWPEIDRFLPMGVENPSKIALPAVSIADLNAELGVTK